MNDRPYSQWERSVLLALTNAHKRMDELGYPAADIRNDPTNASLMLTAEVAA